MTIQVKLRLLIPVLLAAFCQHNSARALELVHFSSATLTSIASVDNSSKIQKSTVESEEGFPIWGHLGKPKGVGPFPAVILMHGCSGIQQSHLTWASLFSNHGFVTLIVDSFRPRNILSVCKNFVRSASPPERALDAYGGFNFLKSKSYVNFQRIGLIGWSHGGVSALHATNRLGISTKVEQRFRAAVAFYPYCIADRSFDLPVLIMIGESDDWTPPDLCEELYRRNKISGNSDMVQLIVYPDAYHAFDIRDLESGYTIEDGNGRKHLLMYNDKAYKDSVERVITFFKENI